MGSEEILRHLRWYLTTEPTPQGRLEAEFGGSQAPGKLYIASSQPQRRQAPAAAAAPAPAPAAAPTSAPPPDLTPKNLSPGLDILIDWLLEEVEDKQLKERAAKWREVKVKNPTGRGSGLLKRRGCEGPEALDLYVSWIVAALRDFPYLSMPEGRDAGIWIRDEVIAKVFEERWDFYNNKKLQGFDLEEFYEVLRILLKWLKDIQKELKED